MSDKEFVKGIYWNEPSERSPDFIKGRLSFKVKDAIEYLQEKENEKGYVNVDVKVSRDGRTYLDLNDWTPAPKIETVREEKPPRDVSKLEPEDSLQDNEMPVF